ncbi:protein kinase domain-containing protein [Scytonema sp. NUACC26]|uniref:protein kinase domain-containing protein n=1 Tax=Scytonema sp. NUACC26 TaxID=3140176 RepID=UPI0034DBAD2D
MQSQMLGGRYQIIAQLGKGGFGITFLALDMQRPGNPKCVVKQFKPMFTDPLTMQVGQKMFNQEAEILEKLGYHDQIPRFLAHFEENQEFYIAQEFVEGHDISVELPLKAKSRPCKDLSSLVSTFQIRPSTVWMR